MEEPEQKFIEPKHTPGPWRVTDRSSGTDWTKDDVMTVEEPSIRICNVYGGLACERGIANAQLIATAPDMFDFIMAASNTITENHDPKQYKGIIDAIQEEAFELVKKATGFKENA